MNLEQYLAIEDKLKPRTMRKWISRSKNLFKDVPVKVYSKIKENDFLYCNVCGAMPDKVYGTVDPNDPTECLNCFKNLHSADEFLV